MDTNKEINGIKFTDKDKNNLLSMSELGSISFVFRILSFKYFNEIDLIEKHLPWSDEDLTTLIENFEYSFKNGIPKSVVPNSEPPAQTVWSSASEACGKPYDNEAFIKIVWRYNRYSACCTAHIVAIIVFHSVCIKP